MQNLHNLIKPPGLPRLSQRAVQCADHPQQLRPMGQILWAGVFAEVAPAARYEEQVGAKVIEGAAIAAIGDLGAGLKGAHHLVAVEGMGEADQLTTPIFPEGERGPQPPGQAAAQSTRTSAWWPSTRW